MQRRWGPRRRRRPFGPEPATKHRLSGSRADRRPRTLCPPRGVAVSVPRSPPMPLASLQTVVAARRASIACSHPSCTDGCFASYYRRHPAVFPLLGRTCIGAEQRFGLPCQVPRQATPRNRRATFVRRTLLHANVPWRSHSRSHGTVTWTRTPQRTTPGALPSSPTRVFPATVVTSHCGRHRQLDETPRRAIRVSSRVGENGMAVRRPLRGQQHPRAAEQRTMGASVRTSAAKPHRQGDRHRASRTCSAALPRGRCEHLHIPHRRFDRPFEGAIDLPGPGRSAIPEHAAGCAKPHTPALEAVSTRDQLRSTSSWRREELIFR
jgi:hypothetical protein